MKFTKMHGIGNDYVYVSTFDQPSPPDPSKLAVAISDRHFGVGSDGLILIEPSRLADARMRMFNADGSESEMCGNGVRCVAKYIFDHEIARKLRVTIETGRGILALDLEVESGMARRVQVDMGPPILQGSDIPTTLPGNPPIDSPIEAEGHFLAGTAVSMGNPHVVFYVEDVAEFPVETVGPAVERHPSFPRRVNVHFVEVVSPVEVRMRTWERGSGITLACGTGACAVAVAGVLTGRTTSKILGPPPGRRPQAGLGRPPGPRLHDRAGRRGLFRSLAWLSDGPRHLLTSQSSAAKSTGANPGFLTPISQKEFAIPRSLSILSTTGTKFAVLDRP